MTRLILIVPLSVLLLSACRSPEFTAAPPVLPAGAELTDESRLSFLADFDDRSFRALTERAFTDEDAESREQAAGLLNDVVWNWHPDLPQLDARRRRARSLLLPLTGHADARVRTGIWRLARFLFDDPSAAAPASEALVPALADPDPDVRLAALRTAFDFHKGHTGGCILDRKKTTFTLRTHLDRLSARLFVEPDPRVRAVLLRALAWCGRDAVLPLFTRYFSEADRREEVSTVGGTVLSLFQFPATGLESALEQRHGDSDGAWDRFQAFTDTLTASRAAHRNGTALVLFMASEACTTVREDRGLLRRVIEGLERDEEGVREEDLHLILAHWRVMDPSEPVHRPNDAVRRSSVPAFVKSLREILAAAGR